MEFFDFLYRNGLWISIPILIVGVTLLGSSIKAVIRLRVEKQILSVPIAVVFKKDGKVIEAKAGSQFADDMTPARAAKFRANLIEGSDKTREERRQEERAAKEAEEARWTINRLWDSYCETFSANKVLRHEAKKGSSGKRVPE